MRVLASLMLLMSGGADAHEAGHVERQVVSSKAELNAAAAFGRDGRLWAVSKAGQGKSAHVVLSHSADLGRTWSAPVKVNAVPEAVAASGDAFPRVALGLHDEIYVLWTQPLDKPFTGDIRFARSLDGGQSFSAPLTVHTDRQKITHRFGSLAVGHDGTLFVAWIDKRDLELAKRAGTRYRGAAIYAAVSKDNGSSFAPDFKLADHSCECCRLAMVADQSGGAWVLWRHVFAPNIRDHALGRIEREGKPGQVQRASFDQWQVDACPHHGPALAQDDQGRLHGVWFTLGEQPGIKYGRWQDGVLMPQSLRNIGTQAAAHADIAVNGDTVVIAWNEFDGKATQLQVMQSGDGGRSWQSHTLARSEEATGQPRVLSHQGRFHVFWSSASQPRQLLSLP